VAVK
jgi:uncharacterized protein YjbJ (UPF0337 family)